MSMNKTEIAAAIDSLDLVLAHDPPEAWRTLCERLDADLRKGASLRERIGFGGLAIFTMVWLALPPETRPPWVWIAGVVFASLAVVGLLMSVANFHPPKWLATLGFLLFVASFSSLPLANSGPHLVFVAGLVSNILSHIVAAQFYPALKHEQRIVLLLVYFGLRPAQDDEEQEPNFRHAG